MKLSSSLYDFRLSGWLAVGLLGSAGITAAVNPALLKAYPDQAFSSGAWASAYQAGFDEALPIRRTSSALMALTNYSAFRDGKSGVLVGRDGWLFSSEEMTPLTDPSAVIAAKAAYVTKISRQLRARGVRVIIALVPAKLRIYPEKSGSYQLLPQLQKTYDDLLGNFRAAGIEAPDLRSPLRIGKRQGAMFLRTDTHWTPEGAAVSSQAIARTMGLNRDWPAVRYRFEPAKSFIHDGDLKHFLPLGPWETVGPPSDVVNGGRYVPISAASESLLGPSVHPVALVGTSYSYNPSWRFVGALDQALEVDVLNASREGRGPFKPMQNYLDDIAANGSPIPKILIWEMPERYFWSTDKTVGLP